MMGASGRGLGWAAELDTAAADEEVPGAPEAS